ncbi:GAF domain-containing protein [Paenibacillus cremeus]|uniref:GAF domain-containing protein n=1 Tax=Paenibacillus cremeus TaxID=2163881 RepID=A0A559K7E8_9BACL|nr:GAF domain-containing protein [Paenibacillus cremeus]TVY08060.1 GAF domain-containing protein [Paenibacillus cremeus]
MDEIVASLKNFKITKEIRELLTSISRNHSKELNIAQVLLDCFQKDLLGSTEYIALRSKILMNRYLAYVRQQFPGFTHSIYLYEHETQKLWNSSVPDLLAAYNEYTHGLCVKNDVSAGSVNPDYIDKVLVIHDVERSDHYVNNNHRTELLKSQLHAFCAMPLLHNNNAFGHQVMFANNKNPFTDQDIQRYQAFGPLIGKELVSNKEVILKQIQADKIT